MEERKVSVIVPVYNSEKYLSKTIESIINQEYSKIELILVNDGSKDNSAGICNDYKNKDPRVVVIHQNNKGVSSARNAGLDKAIGEYIGFVDADDYIKPNMYKDMILMMKKYDAHMVMGGYERVNAATGDRATIQPPREGIGEKDIVDKVIYQMAFWNCKKKDKYLPTLYGSTWPNLYRSDIIKENNIKFNESIALGEDMLFNLQYLLNVQRIVFINKPLYEYFMYPVSATRGKRPHMWQQYVTLIHYTERILEKIYGNDPDFQFNVSMQKIHFATSVIEEQICKDAYIDTKQKLMDIKKITKSQDIRAACKTLNRYKLSGKEWIKVLLFRTNMSFVLYRWLTH